jgi:Uma2 family endonuclease
MVSSGRRYRPRAGRGCNRSIASSLLEPELRIQPFSPALAIEITSPSNTFDELARKTRQYLDAGSHAVWIFVTAMREIHVYSATSHPAILTAGDLLEDAALLPGFSARVEELFVV